MREDNLLILRRMRYVFTTDSRHNWPIYPNLARHVTLTVSISCGWPTLRLSDYVASSSIWRSFGCILPARNRLGFGTHVAGGTGDSSFADGAERAQLDSRGTVHHSDQGVQYASSDYTQILDQAEIQISMSRRGNPYDNALAERFMRTLKEEEVHGTEYQDLEDEPPNR